MPRAPKRCGLKCSNKVILGGKCKEHQPPRVAWQKSEDSLDRSFFRSAEGQRQRRRVLFRDNELFGGCQLRLEGCLGLATHVDHIVPVWYTKVENVSDDDLQGVCSECHQKKSSYEGVTAKKIKKFKEYKE